MSKKASRKSQSAPQAPTAAIGTPNPLAARAHAIDLHNKGLLTEATAAFRAILAANPNDPVALYSLAGLLSKTDVDEALVMVVRGVAAAPHFAPMWFAHGMVMQTLGRKEDALRSYQEALKHQPGYTEALVNSGAMLRELHRHQEALSCFEQALALDPTHESALGNAGILLSEFKRTGEAIATFERVLAQNPDYPYGLGLLCYQKMHACDWAGHDELAERTITAVHQGKKACKTLGLMAISGQAEDHFIAARTFAEHWLPKPQPPLWNGERYGHKRLRIAYVSPDLREHPVGQLMAGVFERHDKSRFETFAFSVGMDDGSVLRQRIANAFEHFIDVRGQGSRQIAKAMRAHEIDIAIDLAGYTSDSRVDLFASRPAPLQITYLGHPGTLGSPYFDYILADRHVIPPEHQRHYTEKVAYLPDSYLPTDVGIQVAERTPTRAECGLPETGPVLCCFSHDYKIHPQLFAAWMRIMKQLPGSVLWLVSRNNFSQANLRREAEAHDIDPARLIFAARVPRIEDHLARYRLADVFLDTSPYNAHTTAADALLAGLPVITFMGNAFPARVAGSLLHAIGLPELIADSLADYEALAVALVSDPARLADLKARLAANKHTHALFDTDRFCRNLEQMLCELAGQPAAAVAAEPAAAQAALTPDRSVKIFMTALQGELPVSQKSIDELHRSKLGKVSDKWESYLGYYDTLFAPLRNKPVTMLEIGVQNGGSLETWSQYFAEGERFIGCDIDPKCGGLQYDDPRVSVVVGDANAAATYQAIRSISPEFDIVIDDGSHISTDVINAFLNYFPLVKPGGLFVVEDTHTLYDDNFGGGILNEYGAYAFFKKLVDMVSVQFWRDQVSINTYFRTFFPQRATPAFLLDGWVDSVEFRNSVITIRKAVTPGHEKLGVRIQSGSRAQVQNWRNTFVPTGAAAALANEAAQTGAIGATDATATAAAA